MVSYKVLLHKQALKDLERLKQANLGSKAKALKERLEQDPHSPPYEKLVGNLSGAYSRRINIQHRMIYTIDEDRKEVRILRMWTHYEK